jgi:hypothetical protein
MNQLPELLGVDRDERLLHPSPRRLELFQDAIII